MPVYSFRNKETNEVFDKMINFESKEQYLVENPDLEQIYTSMPPMGDSVRLGLKTTDSGFKDVLHKIASANYKSDLKSKLSRN